MIGDLNNNRAVIELAGLLRYKRITNWLKFFIVLAFAALLFLGMAAFFYTEIRKDT